MNRTELQLLENWLKDESFRNWALDANPEDHEKWESWWVLNPHRRELAEIAALVIRGVDIKEDEIPQMVSKLSLENTLMKIEQRRQVAKKRRLRQFLTRAAVWIGLVAVAGAIYWFYPDSQEFVQTGFGEQKEIVLPDHSVVLLNANSSIAYHSRNFKEIDLVGEALFKITKRYKPEERLQVKTADLTIEVMGTTFNVNTRRDKTEVFLEEGKINLELKDATMRKLEMEPGELVRFSQKTPDDLEKTRPAKPKSTDWTEGTIDFDEPTPVLEVFQKIMDVYGLEVVTDQVNLEGREFGGGLPLTDEKMALEMLAKVLSLDFEKKGGQIILREVEPEITQ